MNILLWVLQVLAALLYLSSGVMKVFMFDKVSQDVPSQWNAAGKPPLTILAATVLSVESLVFVGGPPQRGSLGEALPP